MHISLADVTHKVVSADTPDEALRSVLVAFSSRLNYLLDKSDVFPRANAGRYQELGLRYGANRQQAFRWCSEEAVPNPAVLLRMAKDFDTTVDWLLGAGTEVPTIAGPASTAGASIPAYRLIADAQGGGLTVDSFEKFGTVLFTSSSHTTGRPYAFLENWAESEDPPFKKSDSLLIDLGIQALENGAYYLIRTPSNTSVRKAIMDDTAGVVRFERKTPVNTFTTAYPMTELFFNQRQRFDVDWRDAGVLIIGKVESYLRSMMDTIPSFL